MTARDDELALRERLQQLADDNGGRLTPQAVVADARDPESPLHSRFTWDDAAAAEQHRLSQARQIIRSVEVVIKNTTTTVRAPYYVRDPEAGAQEQGYVALKAVRGEAELAREVVVEEFSRAAHILRRAQNVARALGMEGEVAVLVEQITALRERVELASHLSA